MNKCKVFVKRKPQTFLMRFFSMLSTAKTCSPAAGSSIFSARCNTSQCARDNMSALLALSRSVWSFASQARFSFNSQMSCTTYFMQIAISLTSQQEGRCRGRSALCRGFTEQMKSSYYSPSSTEREFLLHDAK